MKTVLGEEKYKISVEESKRINILKCIAILLVVFLHSYNTGMNFSSGTVSLDMPKWLITFENIISENIARAAVPIFFIVSSILLFKKERKYGQMIKEKVKSLFIPYIIWNTIWIIIFFVAQNINVTSQLFANADKTISTWGIKEFIDAYGFTGKTPFLCQLWFMRDLMVLTLISPVFKFLSDKAPKLYGLIMCTLVFFPCVNDFKTAVSCFMIGLWIVKKNFRVEKIDKINYKLILPIYIILIVLNLILANYYTRVFMIIVGVIFITKLSKDIVKSGNKLINFLQNYTFIIYVGHELALSTSKKICLKLLPTTPIFLLLEYIILPIIIILICVLSGNILKKYVPKLYSVLTGTR